MILSSLLSSSSYIIVNKDLIRILGINEALLLGELCSEYVYWENRQELVDDNYFYSTRENIQANTGLTPHYQRLALKTLISNGIISTKQKGIPCKTYYKLHEDKLMECFKKAKIVNEDPVVNDMNNKTSIDETTSNEKSEQQDIKAVNTNNNNINNNKNNNLILSYPENTNTNIDKIDRYDYEKLFKKNIEYDILIQNSSNAKIIEDIKNIVTDTLSSNKESIYISSEPKPIELVKSQLLKLDSRHIEYVINCFNENTNEIKNRISYLLTSLYNAVNTFNIDVTLGVARIINTE